MASVRWESPQGVKSVNEGREPDRPLHEVDPWARGGAMSDATRWVSPVDRLAAAADSADGTSVGRRRHRARGPLIVGGVVVVLVMFVAGRLAVDDPAANKAERTGSVGPTGAAPELIDRLRWTQVSGDSASLPADVIAATGSQIVGRDDDGAVSWRSVDGILWTKDQSVGITEVAGERWAVGFSGGRYQLLHVTETGATAVATSDDAASRQGVVASLEAPSRAARDIVMDAGGEVFARLDRREEVDWRAALGLEPTDGYRVRVRNGEDEESFESASAEVDDIVDYTAERSGDRIVLRDAGGAEVWSVGAVEPGDDVFATLRPRVHAEWARWDGDRFEVVPTPWSPNDVVEVAQIADRVVAVATVTLDSGPRVWSTADGEQWKPVKLPVEPSEDSPMPITVGRDEIVLTISDGAVTSHWSMLDAGSFQQLPDIPGISNRSHGSFGWVAPDPRNSPVLRVSRDGISWAELDLSDQLGYDAARWDAQLEATAIGDEIYVTSTLGNRRTLLIGTIDTAPSN